MFCKISIKVKKIINNIKKKQDNCQILFQKIFFFDISSTYKWLRIFSIFINNKLKIFPLKSDDLIFPSFIRLLF